MPLPAGSQQPALLVSRGAALGSPGPLAAAADRGIDPAVMELELEGMEEAARALESVMEDEVEARIEEQMRLLEERLKGIGEGAGN